MVWTARIVLFWHVLGGLACADCVLATWIPVCDLCCALSGRQARAAVGSARLEDLLLLGGGAELLPWLPRRREGRALHAVGPAGGDWPRETARFAQWPPEVRAWHVHAEGMC